MADCQGAGILFHLLEIHIFPFVGFGWAVSAVLLDGHLSFGALSALLLPHLFLHVRLHIFHSFVHEQREQVFCDHLDSVPDDQDNEECPEEGNKGQ